MPFYWLFIKEIEKKKEISRKSSRLRKNLLEAKEFEKAQNQYREVSLESKYLNFKNSIKDMELMFPKIFSGYNHNIMDRKIRTKTEKNFFIVWSHLAAFVEYSFVVDFKDD